MFKQIYLSLQWMGSPWGIRVGTKCRGICVEASWPQHPNHLCYGRRGSHKPARAFDSIDEMPELEGADE